MLTACGRERTPFVRSLFGFSLLRLPRAEAQTCTPTKVLAPLPTRRPPGKPEKPKLARKTQL